MTFSIFHQNMAQKPEPDTRHETLGIFLALSRGATGYDYLSLMG